MKRDNRADRRNRTERMKKRGHKVLRQAGLVDPHPSYYACNDVNRKSHLDDIRKQRKFMGSCKERKPLDCGNTQCGLCHSHKYYEESVEEKKSKLDFKEQKLDLD